MRKWPVFVIFGAFLIGAVFIVYLFGGGSSPENLLERAANLEAEQVVQREAQAEGDRVRARIRLDEAIHVGDAALTVMKEAEDELDRWAKEISALLTNQEGKELAGFDAAVVRFPEIYNQERPTRTDVDALRSRLEALVTAVKDARDKELFGFDPEGKFRSDIDREAAAAKRIRDEYRNARKEISDLLTAARKEAAPSHLTLEEAIRSRDARIAGERAGTLQRAQETARAEAALEDAVAEKTRIVQESDAAREAKLAEAAAQATAAALEASAQATVTSEKSTRDYWETLASNPAVQAKFQPFLAKGRRGAPCQPYWNYDVPQPMRLAHIQRCKIDTDFNKFLKAITGWSNDRPSRPAPKTQEQKDAYAQDFEMFRNLLPVWVDSGLIPR